MDGISKTHLNAGFNRESGKDAPSVILSLREPHTTPSVAYLPCVSVCVTERVSVCVCVWALMAGMFDVIFYVFL